MHGNRRPRVLRAHPHSFNNSNKGILYRPVPSSSSLKLDREKRLWTDPISQAGNQPVLLFLLRFLSDCCHPLFTGPITPTFVHSNWTSVVTGQPSVVTSTGSNPQAYSHHQQCRRKSQTLALSPFPAHEEETQSVHRHGRPPPETDSFRGSHSSPHR